MLTSLSVALLPSESRLEKPVRASYLTTLNRNLNKKTILVADGLNYIKGYRYQMNCSAKEAGVRYCTVSTFLALGAVACTS